MCQIAKRLLAEKLIDDFYEDYTREGEHEPQDGKILMERLKALLPREHHEMLLLWESECNENGGRELRQFADFVAGILMSDHRHEEGDGK